MEDTLVSFETAKLAKEKGFKEGTRYAYDKYGQVDSAQEYTGEPLFSEEDMDNSKDNHSQSYLAPTQSLLQKWLREQGWGIEVRYDDEGYFVTTYHMAKPSDESPYELGKTYEECLEKALMFLLNQL